MLQPLHATVACAHQCHHGSWTATALAGPVLYRWQAVQAGCSALRQDAVAIIARIRESQPESPNMRSGAGEFCEAKQDSLQCSDCSLRPLLCLARVLGTSLRVEAQTENHLDSAYRRPVVGLSFKLDIVFCARQLQQPDMKSCPAAVLLRAKGHWTTLQMQFCTSLDAVYMPFATTRAHKSGGQQCLDVLQHSTMDSTAHDPTTWKDLGSRQLWRRRSFLGGAKSCNSAKE